MDLGIKMFLFFLESWEYRSAKSVGTMSMSKAKADEKEQFLPNLSVSKSKVSGAE